MRLSAGIPRQAVAPHLGRLPRRAEDESLVDLAHLAPLELGPHRRRERFIRGRQQDAGGRGVEAVEQPEAALRRLVAFAGQIVGGHEQRAPLFAGAVGMREDAGRFGESGEPGRVAIQQRHAIPER